MVKEPSRQALERRELKEQRICPRCRENPLAYDPRQQRDIQIRLRLRKGESVDSLAAAYSLTPRMVRNIRNQKAGEPKFLGLCESCRKLHAKEESESYHRNSSPAQASSAAAS